MPTLYPENLTRDFQITLGTVIDVVDGPNTQHLSHDRNQGVVVYDSTWEYRGGGPPSHGEGGD